MSKVIHLHQALKIPGSTDDIVIEVTTITPPMATDWLRCNRNNRPVRRKHVLFLADQISKDQWEVNGQAIIISDDEQVLDGQHRLLAVIESGKPIKSLVIYGIKPEAFKTIDTGAVRTGADALSLHYPQLSGSIIKAAATAVQLIKALERGSAHSKGKKISNTEVIEYVSQHLSILRRAEILESYPNEARPMGLGTGTGLYEMFARKSDSLAEEFMRNLYTGENLTRTNVEYILRQAFIKDANSNRKYPPHIKIMMTVKGWNWRRRGRDDASMQVVQVSPNDPQNIVIW